MVQFVPPLIQARPRRFTRAEYDRLIELGFFQRERIELIHGVLCRMSPIGIAHANAVVRLGKLLTMRVGDRAQVRAQQPFCACDESEPEPDIAIVPEAEYTAHPDSALLIIEVADSSLEYDRETKAPLYAASGVPEYWILNLIERTLEIHTSPDGARYASIERVGVGKSAAPRAFPDIRVEIAALLR